MRPPIASALLFLLIEFTSVAASLPREAPGELNHIEGAAYLNGLRLTDQQGKPSFLASGDTLRTTEGRAEVLLNPGNFLRIDYNTELKLVSLDANEIRVRLMKGKLLLDIVELDRGSPYVVMGASVTVPLKPGIYEFDAARCRLEVYGGRAQMRLNPDRTDLRNGNAGSCEGARLEAREFDAHRGDALFVWSAWASEYDAEASYGAARGLKENSRAAWYWNPVMNCWAFVPAAGIVSGSFGWAFAAPLQLSRASLFIGPVFHYPAVANQYDLPRRLSLPTSGGTVDIAHSPRIARRDIRSPIDMGPGAPSILR